MPPGASAKTPRKEANLYNVPSSQTEEFCAGKNTAKNGCRRGFQSQGRDQTRRSDQQSQPRARAVDAPGPRRRSGPLGAAAGGIGARVGDARVDVVGSAHLVDHGGGVDVVEVERLALVGRRGGVGGHGLGEARVAGRDAARGQAEAEGQVVDVAVRRGGLVGDGVGEAVVRVVVVLVRVRIVAWRRAVLQARGVVRDVVGEEAGVGLADLRVFAVVVVLAGARGAEGEGEGGHEG